MTVPENRPQVLVVEDEALLLFSLADDLRSLGFDVLEASNADDAIAILNANPRIDLLFTDIDMPGSMDGLRLAHVVRERWPPVRIVITSGKSRPADTLLPLGGSFMPKPYSVNSVAATLRALMD